MDVAGLLRVTRRQRGLGQAALARRAGTTQTYVSRVERGVVSPSLATLERLLHAMGVSLRLSVAPLPHGNQTVRELHEQLVALTPAERLEQAMELSEFLTGVAASSPDAPHDGTP